MSSDCGDQRQLGGSPAHDANDRGSATAASGLLFHDRVGRRARAMLMIGCDGGTNATSGVVPELTKAIYEAAQAGEWDRAVQLQYRLLPLFDAMISVAEFPEGFRRGALIRGLDLGPSRQPLSEVQTHAADKAQQRLEELLSGYRLDRARPTSSSSSASQIVADDAVIDRSSARFSRN